MALEDLPNPVTPHVFLRGKPDNPGPEVPRQFLEVLFAGNREPFKDGSGRLELARAIASKNNPLTARVMVNRIWQHHFGEGIVAHAERLRRPRRTADAPRIAGLAGRPPSWRRAGRSRRCTADAAVEYVSAGEQRGLGGRRRRTRKTGC